MSPRTLQSDYMAFAKLETAARYGLASSGVADCDLDDLEFTRADLALHGPNAYGYAPLIEAIASRFGVPGDCVVTAGGCSFANHLALAALVAPGDEVLIEEPTYKLLLSALGFLGARIVRFPRRLEDRWALDADAVARLITGRTRLVVLTDLHNPSSARAAPGAVAAIAEAAARVGARVLVDEVYRELTFGEDRPTTAFSPDGNVVATSSLTKAYGLSGLRCGWILAPPDLAHAMRRLNDLYAVAPPHVAERLSVLAFEQLPRFRRRATALLDANRSAYREILGDHPALQQVIFEAGTTVFPRLRSGDGDRLYEALMRQWDTSLVPGRFFDRPDHVRIGLGGDPDLTRAGLINVARALDAGAAG
jgi:aspartate/methionine/tyrosine aminotransferase